MIVQSAFKCPDGNLGLLCHNRTTVIFRHATNTYEVNIATSWMISRIKKVNIELFFYFFSESRHDFRKFSPVKQVIKKVWP